jgi:hypothetical protein
MMIDISFPLSMFEKLHFFFNYESLWKKKMYACRRILLGWRYVCSSSNRREQNNQPPPGSMRKHETLGVVLPPTALFMSRPAAAAMNKEVMSTQ